MTQTIRHLIIVLTRLGLFKLTENIIKREMSDGSTDYETLYEVYVFLFERYPQEFIRTCEEILIYLQNNSRGDTYHKSLYELVKMYKKAYQFGKVEQVLLGHIESNRPSYIDNLVTALMEQKKYSIIDEYVERQEAIWNLNPDAVLQRVQLCRETNQSGKIKEIYLDYLRRASNLVVSHYFMAKYLYTYEGDVLGSKVEFDKAFSLISTDKYLTKYEIFESTRYLIESMYWDYSFILAEIFGVTEAKAYAETNMDNESFRNIQIEFLILDENYSEAKECIEEKLSKDSSPWEKHSSLSILGRVLLNMGEVQNAKKILLDSIGLGEALNHPYIDDYVRMSECLLYQSTSEIDAYMNKANDLDIIEAIITQLSIKIDLQKWIEAITISQKIQKQHSLPVEWEYYVAKAYKESNQIEEAILHYKAILEFQPRNIVAMIDLAELYLLKRETPKVKTIIQEIRSFDIIPNVIKNRFDRLEENLLIVKS